MLRLPRADALDAAHGSTIGGERPLTVIGFGSGTTTAWGECAALENDGYWHETAADSYEVLRHLAPHLIGRPATEILESGRGGRLLPAARPMARAAVEMAALDMALRQSGQGLAAWLGSTRSTVPAGATVGLGPAQAVAEQVIALARQGYGRIKFKIEPTTAATHAVEVAHRVGAAIDAELELHVDANGSFPPAGESREHDSVDLLLTVAGAGVSVIEQPFPTDDLDSGRRLRQTISQSGLATLVLADEAAVSEAQVATVLQLGSADGVVVKPSRLGGLQTARRVIDAARSGRHHVSVGGMVESALGRHGLAAVAALDGVTVTGDLSPARRWLADDPWPDVETVMVDGRLHAVVPTGPGVAPPPDLDKLDRYTVDRFSVGSPTG